MQKGEEGNQSKQPSDNFSVKAPELSLPRGGGAIRGIGEKFAANPVTGTGAMSIPIATSPGRSGFGPELSLSYDSGSGNGTFGLGWNLALPSITRKTNKGLPQYHSGEEPDVFVLSGAEDLVPVLLKKNGAWKPETLEPRTILENTYHIQRYRPRIEGLFARIEYWTNKNDPTDCFWRSISRDNITTWYGKTDESRIADPDDKTRIFNWLICETYDDKGNVISYRYKTEDSIGINLFQAHELNRNETSRSANRYLKRIRYGNKKPYFSNLNSSQAQDWMFEVVFDYGEHTTDTPMPNDDGAWSTRNDPFSTYRAGFEVRTYRLCQRVLMFHHFLDKPEVGEDCLVRSTDFNYHHKQSPDDSRNPIYTVLDSAIQCGYKQRADGYDKRSLPPVEFTYSKIEIGNEIKTVELGSTENLPIGVDGGNYQWLDLDGEGLSGVLTQQGGAWYYKHNETPITRSLDQQTPQYQARLGAIKTVGLMPVGGLSGISSRQFLDLAGNGQIDLVEFAQPLSGFYERSYQVGEPENLNWQTFRAFKSQPNINWNDPNLKFIDLNGDGHADILITEDQIFTWYPSLAEKGFAEHKKVAVPGDEEQGPHVIFADIEQSIIQADLSGDGLTDIARIRNGEICYWPNLGYGRFGAKVAMDNAPLFDNPDQFNPNRIRLADIDGSGVTDIIYLGRNKTQFWFNQSGNSWSDAQILKHFPTVDNITSVAAVDLLGNGTACLVWSSPLPDASYAPMRYIELMAQGKPHLMVGSKNNLGAETHIQYAPSTYFYLKDKQAGKPWITLLPFPVHVVEKVTVTDKWKKTSFSTSYSYHHGYFDGVEREFRGFGRVEQIDVETYGHFSSGNKSSPYVTDDLALYQPPIKTVSWFHTGVANDRKQILSLYQQEYFKGAEDLKKNALPEPYLQQNELTADEWREAMRSCKGMPLRQEIYELDVDALEQGKQKLSKLYSSAYHNCNIQMLQARAGNQHAVFLATESEAVAYQYDLDLLDNTAKADPRIAHTLNLNIDQYGNVLQSVAVVYPRIGEHIDASLPDNTEELIKEVQGEMHLAYTEAHFTNDINEPDDVDNYRLRLPCEVLTYELTGIEAESDYFSLEELQKLRLSKKYQDTGIEPRDLSYHQIPDKNNFEKRIVEHVRMLFFKANLQDPLQFRELNALALPFETYKLALTDDLLEAIFDVNQLTGTIRAEIAAADQSGYLSGDVLAARFAEEDTSGQYWIRSGIAGFADDAADHFFLPERYTDAFNKTSTLEYDGSYDLYIKSSTDPVGNTASVEKFDYRVLAPRELKDINDNITEAEFDVLGLPTAIAIKGKQLPTGEWQWDNLNDFTNASHNDVVDFCISPTLDDAQARQWLGNATTRFIYHFGETIDNATGEIVWGTRMSGACSITREQHKNQTTPLQITLECSDGGGNVLMQKTQAEPDPDTGNPRWIINGLTVLNNKGKPVKQYEPAFTPRFGCEFPQAEGVTPIIYYDATGRTVRTESPDGSYSRVEFSPWHVSSYDQNDTVLEAGNEWYAKHNAPDASIEHKRAAELAKQHADTPAQVFLDSLGRDVIGIEDNKNEKYATVTKLDAEGKPLWIEDARGNRVMQYITPDTSIPCYDIAGNLLFQHSMDGGDKWLINDAAGQPFYAWDKNENDAGVLEDRLYHTVYDDLRRPLEQHLRINNGSDQIIERFVYGDTPDLFPVRPPDQTAEAQERNVRGQLYQHYDSSGLVSNEHFDFKGNLLEMKRQLTSFTKDSITDWTGINAVALDEAYTQNTEYDALNRMTRHYNWHHTPMNVAVYEPRYNKRGVLKSEEIIINAEKQRTVNGFKPNGGERTAPIQAISYDAKGQRQKIVYGNKTATVYDYDAETFRLINLITTNTQTAEVIQNLYYTYDPVGNITEILDDAYEPVFFNNQKVEPRSRYTYDALYRLIEAEGRESIHAAPTKAGKLPDTPEKQFPITDQTLRNYTQSYIYDSVGNIKQMKHVATHGSWTRNYEYEDDSNRLKRTSQGKQGNNVNVVEYKYDTHGSMLNLNNVADEYQLHWDSNDMIRHANLGGGGDAYYDYGSDKERSRKRIVKNNGTIIEERLYLGGMERYRRWKNNVLVEEIESYHLFDGEQRVLMVENVLSTDNKNLNKDVLYRYQYSNHLGSVGLEVDKAGAIISYEEYHPYGTTAYSARNAEIKAVKKRYRYTGMERDEETGLGYHSARYYLPWLGRWGSVDPAGLVDGGNLYGYGRYNPIGLVDLGGRNSSPGSFQRYFNKAITRIILASDNKELINRLLVKKRGRYKLNTKHADGFNAGHAVSGDRVSPSQELAVEKAKTNQVDGPTVEKKNPGMSKHAVEVDIGNGHKLPIEAHTARELELAGHLPPGSGDLPQRPGWTRAELDGYLDNKGLRGRKATSKFAKAGRKALAALPFGIGSFFGQADAAHAASQGNYVEAGLAEIGEIPIIGDVVDVAMIGYYVGGAFEEATGLTDHLLGVSKSQEDAHNAAVRREFKERTGRDIPMNLGESDVTVPPSKATRPKATVTPRQQPALVPQTFMHNGGPATTDEKYWNSLPPDRQRMLELVR